MDAFDKLKYMSNNDMDIQLAPLSNISNVEIKGKNGFITVGVSKALATDFILGRKEFVGGLILANKEQFDALEDGK